MTEQPTTSILSQTQRDHMEAYDALPPALRGWLADARMPWSPASAARAWRTALWRNLGRTKAALAYMDKLEDDRLAKDALTQQLAAQGLVQVSRGN